MKGEKNPNRGGMRVSRRKFLESTTLSGAAGLALRAGAPALGAPAGHAEYFELADLLLVYELQEGMKRGKFTAVSLTEKYLARIRKLDKAGPAINAVIEINPDAIEIARALDRKRKSKGPRGPLHGIPILVKDNIGTHDRMQTTAGSLAMVGAIPPTDSFVARKLRQAGAVILGKTNLSEWANFRSTHSTSGWMRSMWMASGAASPRCAIRSRRSTRPRTIVSRSSWRRCCGRRTRWSCSPAPMALPITSRSTTRAGRLSFQVASPSTAAPCPQRQATASRSSAARLRP